MPPKPKYTKEQISQMAFDIVRTYGISKLTARELGKYMGTSTTPIFSVFDDMDALTKEVLSKSKSCFESYLAVPGDSPKAYESRVYQFVKFAAEEPELFKLLFINDMNTGSSFAFGSERVHQYSEKDCYALAGDTGMSVKQASTVIADTYINAFAYCTLISLKCCPIPMDAIRLRLSKSLTGDRGAF